MKPARPPSFFSSGSFSQGLNPIMLSCPCRSGPGLALMVKRRPDTWRHEFPFGVLRRIRQGRVCFSACKGLFGHKDLFLVPFYFNYWWSFTFFSFHTWRVVIVFCWLPLNGKPLNELWPWEGRAGFVCFPESSAPVELSRLIALLKELLVEPEGSWTFDSRG